MDILTLFLIVPLITIIALVFSKGLKQSRIVSMIGSIVQLGMAINLMFAYFRERAVNNDIMVFTKDLVWFKNFNIHYNIGIDGISVALILLTARWRPGFPCLSTSR
jgi:NADH-quinone oxidoreductase subunit M